MGRTDQPLIPFINHCVERAHGENQAYKAFKALYVILPGGLKILIMAILFPRMKKGFNSKFEDIFKDYEEYNKRDYTGYEKKRNLKGTIRKNKTYAKLHDKHGVLIFCKKIDLRKLINAENLGVIKSCYPNSFVPDSSQIEKIYDEIMSVIIDKLYEISPMITIEKITSSSDFNCDTSGYGSANSSPASRKLSYLSNSPTNSASLSDNDVEEIQEVCLFSGDLNEEGFSSVAPADRVSAMSRLENTQSSPFQDFPTTSSVESLAQNCKESDIESHVNKLPDELQEFLNELISKEKQAENESTAATDSSLGNGYPSHISFNISDHDYSFPKSPNIGDLNEEGFSSVAPADRVSAMSRLENTQSSPFQDFPTTSSVESLAQNCKESDIESHVNKLPDELQEFLNEFISKEKQAENESTAATDSSLGNGYPSHISFNISDHDYSFPKSPNIENVAGDQQTTFITNSHYRKTDDIESSNPHQTPCMDMNLYLDQNIKLVFIPVLVVPNTSEIPYPETEKVLLTSENLNEENCSPIPVSNSAVSKDENIDKTPSFQDLSSILSEEPLAKNCKETHLSDEQFQQKVNQLISDILEQSSPQKVLSNDENVHKSYCEAPCIGTPQTAHESISKNPETDEQVPPNFRILNTENSSLSQISSMSCIQNCNLREASGMPFAENNYTKLTLANNNTDECMPINSSILDIDNSLFSKDLSVTSSENCCLEENSRFIREDGTNEVILGVVNKEELFYNHFLLTDNPFQKKAQSYISGRDFSTVGFEILEEMDTDTDIPDIEMDTTVGVESDVSRESMDCSTENVFDPTNYNTHGGISRCLDVQFPSTDCLNNTRT